MGPFGQILWLWRLERKLTQEQLARQAGIPRPNLSAIERGKREVSLKTLRALAMALGIRPGVLADGVSPADFRKTTRLSRESLERITDGVMKGKPLQDRRERWLAELLRKVVRHQVEGAQAKTGILRRAARKSATAWLQLESICSPEELKSLLQRIGDRELIP